MQLRNLAVAFAGMAFFAVAAFAQVSGVEGIVKSAGWQARFRARSFKIHPHGYEGQLEHQGTNKKGHYIYNGLPYGAKYNVDVDDRRQEVADKQSNIHPAPGEIKTVDFDLKAAKAATASTQAMPQKAMETGKIAMTMRAQSDA